MGRNRRTNKHLPERMILNKGRTYYFIEYGTNKWINLGRDYVEAMALYASIRGPGGSLDTMSDLIDRYMLEIAPTKAKRTYKDNLTEAKNLKAVFGDLVPTDVTKTDIYGYKNERGRTSQVRANREISLLSVIFTYAEEWGVAENNPARGIRKFKETPRDRYIEDWEYLDFKEHAGPLIAAYMDFKLVTGLRQGDVLRLRLDQIQQDGIHVTISKTGKRRIFEWTDELRFSVKQARNIPRPISGMFLFCTRRGTPYTGDGFRSIWQRKMRSALSQKILQERFTDHDIRRKTGSDSASLEEASKLLGHSDVRITHRVYRAKEEVVSPLDTNLLGKTRSIRNE